MRTVLVRFAPAVAVTLLMGCATADMAGENRDMRAMLAQTRYELRQVKAEQERLRAMVENLQHRSGQGASAPVYGRSQGGYDSAGGTPPENLGLGGLVESPPDTQAVAPEAAPAREAGEGEPGEVAGMRGGTPPMGVMVPPGGVRTAGTPPLPSVQGRAGVATPAQAGPALATGSPPAADPNLVGGNVAPEAAGHLELPDVPPSLSQTSFGKAADLLRDGSYEEAVQNLRDFIRDNPESPYADDAQYWIGEAYLRQGAYSKSIIEFNQVVVHYRTGDRAPKALLKQAQVFSQLGDEVDSRISLQKIVNHYPGSEEAREASRLLVGRANTQTTVQ